MGKRKPKVIFLKTIVTQIYAVDDYLVQECGRGNVDKLIESWFKDFSINDSHVTRDACAVGNSKLLVKVEQITSEQEREYCKTIQVVAKEVRERQEKRKTNFQKAWRKSVKEIKKAN